MPGSVLPSNARWRWAWGAGAGGSAALGAAVSGSGGNGGTKQAAKAAIEVGDSDLGTAVGRGVGTREAPMRHTEQGHNQAVRTRAHGAMPLTMVSPASLAQRILANTAARA